MKTVYLDWDEHYHIDAYEDNMLYATEATLTDEEWNDYLRVKKEFQNWLDILEKKEKHARHAKHPYL